VFLERLPQPHTTYNIRNLANGAFVAELAEIAMNRNARRRGLLGRDGLPPGAALLIVPCSSIHTWFMRFTIDVIFVKRDGRVLGTRTALAPWRLAVGWGAYAVVELPAGTVETAGVRSGDRLELGLASRDDELPH
jgi:uncharacterized membrane protein (UPF0127 family)